MNEESIDLESYFAPGKHVTLTTRHDDHITGIVRTFFVFLKFSFFGIFDGKKCIGRNFVKNA